MSPRLAEACPAFEVRGPQVSGDISVIALCGELDHAVAARLRTALRDALAGDAPCHIVLDLSGLAFTDSSGLGVIIAGRKWARARGVMLALAAVPPNTTAILRIAGLEQIFPPHATVAEARAALSAGGAA